MYTHVNYDNMRSLLIGVKQKLNIKINAIDLTQTQKDMLIKIDKIIKTGTGTSFLSDNGTYKNIPLDKIQTMVDNLGVIYNLLKIATVPEQWNNTGLVNMPTARQQFGSALWNDCIYIIGGWSTTYCNKVEIYNIYTNTWTTGTDIPSARYALRSVAYNGKIYCIGGIYGGSTSKLEIYDINSNSWTSGSDMPTARNDFGCIEYNGKIYCIGGIYGSSSYINKVEVYDILSNTWSTLTNMSTARYGFGCVEYNGKIYCIGGAAAGGIINNTEIYDIINNQWLQSSISLPIANYLFGCVIYDNKMYIVGGFNTYKVQIYDFIKNLWVIGQDTPSYRYDSAYIVYNKILYCIGSQDYSVTMDALHFSYNTYTIQLPQTILDKLSLIVTNGTGSKLLTDKGVYQEYIPSGYRELTTDELNILITDMKNTV